MDKPKEKDILIDHEYDGIRELDNDLPPWWLKLFYITIIFGFVYLIYYHVSGFGYSSAEQYKKEMNPEWVRAGGSDRTPSFGFKSPWKRDQPEITPRLLAQFNDRIGPEVSFEQLIAEAKRKSNPEQLSLLEKAFPGNEIQIAKTVEEPVEKAVDLTPFADTENLLAGEKIFTTSCAVCHGNSGQGVIGPNFTDEYWIHGGSMNDIVKLIRVGVPAKGMIPWDKTLTPDEIKQVASYIITLEGTNPANQKAPEGELYKRN